ncbi:elongator complex protein 3 [Olsenella massiliensis]|uniref:elongator complex protein 3 n=1 Tax=Olsenella massiliensis TaxID=1622075 RepID=UPI00071D24B2|nr:tRNA uridine(34) 5-carboxymethylaminomethyl modification radical SAM/GNAT enzyme Elp3 [Olsenella massiliensis]
MEELLLDIIARLREHPETPHDGRLVERAVRRHNRDVPKSARHLSKRHILPFYLRVKEQEPERWRSWGVSGELERRLVAELRMKPRRTASGVATITVITRPAPCSGSCVYCPSDLRMPKSYLASEPACQRAEKNFFDPYLQASMRLRALDQMGHATDKVELIVLGGSWTDYPQGYQRWFVRELFRALNEWPSPEETLRERYALYRKAGVPSTAEAAARFVAREQDQVSAGSLTYNEAVARLYGARGVAPSPYRRVLPQMSATLEELACEQRRNEAADHRVVGLVIETRPDAVTPQSLLGIRELGCTKVQLGVQSTRQEVLDACKRQMRTSQVRRAFSLARLFGFKIHAHLMLNLPTATPELDKEDYATFVSDSGFLPDEVKLYPCSLVAGTKLVDSYQSGRWRPYTEDELLDVLEADVLATPPYVRISRMIRDIGAGDILVGNKKANLRQLVDRRLAERGVQGRVQDVRFREIALSDVELATLRIEDVRYQTAVTVEHFLQWVTPDGRIAGFLRLSLPRWDELRAGGLDAAAHELPTRPGEAMIREVHVYGQAAHLGREDSPSQHQGLGRALVERAADVAREAGFDALTVISAVGTRGYYRRLGFDDAGLYQRRDL